MNISASLIKELREKTGAGMMNCKKALVETEGNIENAIDWLRTKGLAVAAKKSGRTTTEGLVGVAIDGNKAAIIELNAETDFVGRNDEFQNLVRNIALVAIQTEGDAKTISSEKYPNSDKNIAETIAVAIGTIGENINLRRVAKISVKNGVVASYIHGATADNLGKIGVLVAIESSGDKQKLAELGKQIAMHIAATKPEALNRDEVNSDNLEREKAVFKEQAIASGKPENIAEKIVDGRIKKYYSEVVLLEQTFVMDNKSTVGDIITNLAKEIDADIKISSFVYFALGEGIEKDENDFATEVAKVASA